MTLLARPGQGLLVHLGSASARAARSASKWGSEEWGKLGGLWHDLGKFSAQFKDYIGRVDGDGPRPRRGSVNHTSAGAIHAMRRFEAAGRAAEGEALARVIFAHHGALSDRDRFRERLGALSTAAKKEADALYEAALRGSPPEGGPPNWMLDAPLPSRLSPARFWHPLFVRMLFSALVDADRSDAAGAAERDLVPIEELRTRFDRHVADLGAATAASPIVALRRRLLAECVGLADEPAGCFSLDAPTGFGKTLASLGFALHHAQAHRLDRVIYVAPFLTAIEQTADVFRAALGDEESRDIVLEHHSTADRDVREQDEAEPEDFTPRDALVERLRQRENWDARVIVTSNVQFLESLYAHDAGRCRKLHRIARSVILLDEPQSVPVSLMAPIAKALGHLARDYGSSVVFVTATQPAFKKSRSFTHGIEAMRPMVSAPLLAEMRTMAAGRVSVRLPGDFETTEPWVAIADRLAGCDEAALCIVNTKQNARDLFRLVRARADATGGATAGRLVLHLSAGMCSAHRAVVLAAVKLHLDRPGPPWLKVVSTQVVEAGIDLDFPRVMRALAGLAALIQSAGRCNRHGLRPGGVFEVFCPEGGLPPMFQAETQITVNLLRQGRGIFDPATVAAFYRHLRDSECPDRPKVLESLDNHDYTTAGRNFRLIEDTASVVVPYGEGGARAMGDLRRAAGGEAVERLFESVQPFTVSVSRGAVRRLAAAGRIEELERFRLWIALPGAYDADVGLLGADDPVPPSALIV